VALRGFHLLAASRCRFADFASPEMPTSSGPSLARVRGIVHCLAGRQPSRALAINRDLSKSYSEGRLGLRRAYSARSRIASKIAFNAFVDASATSLTPVVDNAYVEPGAVEIANF
jgi:hypothetical protein